MYMPKYRTVKRETRLDTLKPYLKKTKTLRVKRISGKKREKRESTGTLKNMIGYASNIKATFLKTRCTDANMCLTFGREDEKIKTHFDGFTNFKWAEPDIKRIGSVSANGFINEIKYNRDGYLAYAVLKSSVKREADNLLYEFFVGRNFVNKHAKKRYPCFLETYGLFKYNTQTSWNKLKNITSNKTDLDLTNITKLTNAVIANSCRNPTDICILIEHMNNVKSLGDYLKLKDPFFNSNLIKILYQLYMPLVQLSQNFTHYDLHTDNIQIYRPFEQKYISFHYHVKGGKVVHFDSVYIVKIIDYGRSFMKTDKYTSKDFHDLLCNNHPSCERCGEDDGFGFLQNEDSPGENYFIVSTVKNESHDLRALNIIAKSKIPHISPRLKNMFRGIVYSGIYGTEEILERGFIAEDANNEIYFSTYNITDAYDALEYLIGLDGELETTTTDTYEKAGDLHIYTDRDMEYIPVVATTAASLPSPAKSSAAASSVATSFISTPSSINSAASAYKFWAMSP
jgi:hypothetical protein